MKDFLQSKLATVIAGVACFVVGALMPATQVYLFPAGAGLLGLAVTHPADRSDPAQLPALANMQKMPKPPETP